MGKHNLLLSRKKQQKALGSYDLGDLLDRMALKSARSVQPQRCSETKPA